MVLIVLGLVATLAGFLVRPEWTPVAASVLRRGGDILTFSTLTWVVAHMVYAPGRITFRRLQGAVVVYLNLATIFALAYGLIWELRPGAFFEPFCPSGRPGGSREPAVFQPHDTDNDRLRRHRPGRPVCPSLPNLESVLGQFYLAITVARLMTLELEDRRR
jgi:hypothetical protein